MSTNFMGGGDPPGSRSPQMPPTGKPPLPDWDLPLSNATREALRRELSWLPDELFNIYYDAWLATGNAIDARDIMRQSPRYEVYFGGNQRDDGSFRYDEMQYLQIVEDFDDTLETIAGVNPALFRHRYADLIAGNKSIDEFFTQVNELVERVIMDSPRMIDEYSRLWGIDATIEGLVGMALDPRINDLVLNRQITMAEIASEGMERGFHIDKDFAASLFNKDLNEQAAADFFGEAGRWVPALNELARRHADPDDNFDITQFAASEVFNDPIQRKRMRRLVRQEQAAFVTTGGFGVQTSQDTGGLSGLAPR